MSPCPHFALNPESTLINEMPVPSRVASLHHISQPSVRAGQERGCDATKGINWIKFAFGRIEIPVSPPRNGLVSFSCLSRPFHSRQRKVGSTLWRARDPGANIACICQPHFPKMGALIERLLEIGACPRPISDLIFEPIFLIKLFSRLSSSGASAVPLGGKKLETLQLSPR